jgi:hypothetical protein
LVDTSKEKRLFKNISLDMTITLKRFQNREVECELDSSGSGYGSVLGSFELCDKSDSINC